MKEFITICPFAGCHQDCVLRVKVQDGRAVKIESVEMPGEPGERRVCLRGLASLRWVKAKLTQMVPPGTVNIYHGPWPEHFIQGHYNNLIQSIDDPGVFNPALEIDQIVKDTRAAAHMVHYDVLVAVNKD